MRQIVLDTETTGLEITAGHRIIEIGCVELINRRPTGRHFHQHLNPERDIDAGAAAVHGLTREQLSSAPRFADIAAALLEFLRGGELIIHNAAFDLAFLDMELARLSTAAAAGAALPSSLRAACSILDTLTLARERHPGQRNNLDALCKRYGIDSSHRELHGALLDARLLADVYLAMTGGQSVFAFDESPALRAAGMGAGVDAFEPAPLLSIQLPQALQIIVATAAELEAHAQLTALLQKASGGRCVWMRAEQEAAAEGVHEPAMAGLSPPAPPVAIMELAAAAPVFAAGSA